MANFNETLFEKKLLGLKDTQDSISNLSSWCLQQPQHHKKIVQIWLQVLKKVKIEQRLSLFYLANDVIQYSKRKGYDFVESWGTALQRATTMVRGDDKVRTKVLRLFTIWNERNIYDESFLVDLVGLLSSRTPSQASVPDAQDFQPATLISKVRSCKALEDDTDLRLKTVNESHLSLSDADALRCSLKDRRHGDDVVAEVEDGIDKMEAYIRALELEIKERQELIELLDLADVFYETQKGEARIVCNAYRNFGMRVKSLKRKLDELIPSLASPVPSPDINAPSPSPESDIELPDDVKQGLGGIGMSSFIGSMVMPPDRTVLESPQPVQPVHHQPVHHQPVHTPVPPVHHPPPVLYQPTTINTSNNHNLEEIPIQLPNFHEPPPPPPNHTIPPPQTQSSFISPLSSTYNPSVLPPLLGDGQDFPINGGESFLGHSTENHSPLPSFLGTDLSFIGNSEFQFDFQKDDLLHNDSKPDLDTPASPPENMPDDSLSDELTSRNISKEGKPIEVISSTKNESGFNLADFLKSFIPPQENNRPNRMMPNDQVDSSVEINMPIIDTSVPPPPLVEPFPEKLWNSNLPPKFPSWGDSQASWGDGVGSPPGYKEGFGNDSLDYEIPVAEDVTKDEEVVLRPPVEIDHRNLISLTGSPLNNDNQWQRPLNVGFRKGSLPDNRDIVESVDMEMSDEEEPQMHHGTLTAVKLKPPPPVLLTPSHKNQLNRKFHKPDVRSPLEPLTGGHSQSISFNIPVANKILSESPLKEKEEPKKKLPLHKLIPSPPRNIIDVSEMMPPPLPPVSLSQEINPVSVGINVTSQPPPMNRQPSMDGTRGDSEFHVEKGDSGVVKNNNLGPPFSKQDSTFCKPNFPNSGPRFPNAATGPGFISVSEDQGNITAPKILEVDNLVVNNEEEVEEPAAEEKEDSTSVSPEEEIPWIPPLTSPPPFPPRPLLMPHGPGFRPRGSPGPGGPPWRGPRRGMSPRFRPGGSPHQGNFQSPHMGPRPPFRGNNWRPRFNKW